MGCYYFKSILVAFCLLAFSDVSAQFSIYPYEDYAACKTGFLRSKRDTVYKAKFENLSVVNLPTYVGENPYSRKKAWILSENNKYGCLNESGKWMLPCIYDNVEFNELCNQFIVRLNGKVGMLSARRDSVLLPIVYDRIFPEIMNNTFYGSMFIQKGNLLGIYNQKGIITIEPAYESLTRIYRNPNDYWESSGLFLSRLNGKMGLVSETGRVILEPIYEHVKLFDEESSYNWEMLFLVTDTLGNETVFSETGKQLLPFNKLPIEPAFTLRVVAENKAVAFGLRRDSLERQQIVSLSTGKESLWYDELAMIGDHILVHSNNQWSILDTTFNVVYENKKTTDGLFYFEYEHMLLEAEGYPSLNEREQLHIYKEVLRESFNKTSIPPIFGIRRVIPASKKEQKHDLGDKEYYGLINLETGITSPIIYSDIFRIGSSKGVYYWAVGNQGFYSDEEYTVDVYDSSGVFLRTACLDKYEYRVVDDYYGEGIGQYGRRTPFLVSRNQEKKMSVRLFNGTRITPYILDSAPGLFNMTNDSVGVYSMQEYSRVTGQTQRFFVDFQGRPLLNGRRFDTEQGETWEDYGYPPPEIEALKSNGQYTIVNRKLEVLLDSCAQLFHSGYQGLNLGKTSYQMAVKNDYVYVYHEGNFQVLDSSFFISPAARNTISKGMELDPSGKWMREEIKKVPVKPTTHLYGSCYFTLTENTLKVEDQKHKVIQFIPNVRTYYNHNGVMTIYTNDTTQGVLDTQTGKWLLQPLYREVKLFVENQKDQFWVREMGKWFIVDTKGESLTIPLFDYPASMNYSNYWFLFESDRHIGIMNKAFQVVVEPTFTKHWKLDQRDVLVRDGEFYFVNAQTGIPFHVDKPFVNQSFSKGLLFLTDEHIQILSFTGEVLLPTMKIKDAERNLNLINYLEPPPATSTLPYVLRGHVYAASTDTVLWRLNNRYLIEDAKRNVATLNQWMKRETITKADCTILPIWVSKKMYSELVTGSCALQVPRGKSPEMRSYRNFFVTETGLVPMKLSDLFVEGSNYMQRIDSLLEQQIQEKQFFGPTCIDMPGAIEAFKRDFYLNGDFIFFEHVATGSLTRLSLKEFGEMVKEW